jgi:hypothetical protein
VPPRSVKEPTG